MYIASQLNLAANYSLRFLKFDFAQFWRHFGTTFRKISIIAYMGIRFLAITQPLFGQSSLNFLGLYCHLSFFWALLRPKKGRGPTDTHMGLGPQTPTKKFTDSVDLLCHLLSQNCVSNFFDLGPPPH